MPVSTDLARARTAWLTGDAAAWARYLFCLRRMHATVTRRDRPRARRRPGRRRA